jgi:DNA-binding transcriptional MerR regulator
VSNFTIGEVLNRLKDEFDDITISKIRFLEAEGLISPDRTESGYRKFTEADIDRLRYVLRAQRDRYLPLKVIKEELDRIDAGHGPDDGIEGSSVPGSLLDPELAADEAAAALGVHLDPATPVTAKTLLAIPAGDLQLSARELCDAAGISSDVVAELRDHGLLGPGPSYDGDDLRVTRIAVELLERGLEVRHLRMYRQFADREAALVEQLVTPLLRQRNPDSRSAAIDQAEHLAASGGALYQALLAKQLRAALRR